MRLTIALPVGLNYGWGICGSNISRVMPAIWKEKTGGETFILPTNWHEIKGGLTLDDIKRFNIDIDYCNAFAKPPWSGETILVDGVLLAPAGNPQMQRLAQAHGDINAGYFFFEDEQACREHAQLGKWDILFGGSTWNSTIASEVLGRNCPCVFQGVDTDLFQLRNPSTRRVIDGPLANPYIFSGGKFEYRKGQDIVMAAFKLYQEKHPDAHLLYAWKNAWPESLKTMEQSNLIQFKYSDSHLHALYDIFEPNGISMLKATPVPASSQVKQSTFIRQYADIAVFPNRSEGGTNLVAMECIASGVPTILNPATGQSDLIDYAVALCDQNPHTLASMIRTVASDYPNRQERALKAAKEFRERFTWENTCRTIIKELRAAQLIP